MQKARPMLTHQSFEHLSHVHQQFLKDIGTTTGCAAKWFQSTVHLQNGLTQSCYNTPQHKIDLQQLQITPKALHNTSEKAAQREQMKKNQRPKGCEFCWRMEDQNSHILSDRQRWNGYLGAQEDVKSLSQKPANFMFDPKVLEVSFSNLCNFMCGYCHPKNSSRFFNEIQQYGPYKETAHSCDTHFMNVLSEDDNPYLDAFWKWWPDLSRQLKTIRLTGGEPLIQRSTQILFEKLLEDPRPQLNLYINSNLGMTPKIFAARCAEIRKLLDTKSIRKIKFVTSLDTWGKQAEYIRYGMDLEIFKQNVNDYLEKFPQHDISFTVTFNIFSLPQFTDLMEYWLQLKRKFNGSSAQNRIRTDLNILAEPIVFSYLLLPDEVALPMFDRCIQFAKDNMDPRGLNGFTNLVAADLLKLRNDFILSRLEPNVLARSRKQFVHFFRQYDERKGLSLTSTFPEFKELVESW